MTLPAVCKPPNPNTPKAIVATVRDATTGAKVAGLVVTVERPPGPPVAPDKVATGKFVYNTMPPGPPTRLQVSAPGHAALGDAATPGIDVAQPPGPPNLPPNQAVTFGIVVKILLG